MFGWLGEFVVRRAWWVIGGWLAVAIAIIATAPSLADITSSDQGSFLPAEYESVQAIDLAKKAFPQQTTSTAIIVVKRSDGQPLTTTDQAKVDQAAQALLAKNIPDTSGCVTGPPAVAPDKSIQIINVGLDAPTSPTTRRCSTRSGRCAPTSATDAGGHRSDRRRRGRRGELRRQRGTFNSAFAIVGTATIVLILGLILIIFRSPVAALLPVFVIGIVLRGRHADHRRGGRAASI